MNQAITERGEVERSLTDYAFDAMRIRPPRHDRELEFREEAQRRTVELVRYCVSRLDPEGSEFDEATPISVVGNTAIQIIHSLPDDLLAEAAAHVAECEAPRRERELND